MKKIKKKIWSRASVTNSGILYILEKIIRSHPLLYFLIRKIIRFTNIFEEDAKGVKILNLSNKVNIFDIGASDGIASKFFLNNLNVNKIYCFEPDKNYIKILKDLNKKKIILKPFALGDKDQIIFVYYPEYRIFGKKLKLVTLCYYNKLELQKQLSLDFKFRDNLFIVKEKLKIKKLKTKNYKIDLIKIDVNGYEYNVVKELIHIIKKNKPALLIETNKDTYKIRKILKKYAYNQYIYLNKHKLFKKSKSRSILNAYFLQDKHLN